MKRILLVGCTALALACNSGKDAPASSELHAKLDLEIREQLTVDLAIDESDAIDAKIVLSDGFGIAPAKQTLSGKGYVERFPEADMILYTSRFTLKGDGTGPCGDDYVSLALALHQRGREPRLSGSLTAYCGAYRYHGVPARNPLRVATPAPGLE
jgi:hypothetical protein